MIILDPDPRKTFWISNPGVNNNLNLNLMQNIGRTEGKGFPCPVVM